MKTAMELALARIEMLYGNKDDIHWEMFKNDCMEKEKEAILNAYVEGRLCSYNDNPSIKANEYYNQTYNQKK
jgi:hypothetical protein